MSEENESEIASRGADLDFPDSGSIWEQRERANRLRDAVRNAGGNKIVAERAGIHVSNLNHYLKDRDMKASTLIALADACDVSLEWLATGRDAKRDPGLISQQAYDVITGKGLVDPSLQTSGATMPPGFIMLPRYDARAAAGAGEEVVSEAVSGHLAFSTNWISTRLRRRPDHLVVIAAVGLSMSPTIGDGDIMVVDTSVVEPKSDGIYVLSVGGALLVKRVQIRLDGSYNVSGDNPAYASETFHPSEEARMRVVGQVLWHGGMVR